MKLLFIHPPVRLGDVPKHIPYPAYDHIPLEIYFENSALMFSPESAAATRRIDILMERGCPRMCTFCEHGGMSKYDLERVYEGSDFKEEPIYRFNSPEYTVEMVRSLRFKYGVDFVSILDENMTSSGAAASIASFCPWTTPPTSP